MNAKSASSPSASRDWIIYSTLVAGVLVAWLPLLGRSIPVNDDYAFMGVVREHGFVNYFHVYGFWRLIGQFLPIWVFLQDPHYHPLLVLATHLTIVILFFHVCRSFFGGTRLPVAAALVFAMVPFGFQDFTWICTYNYLVPVLCFLASLLLLIHEERWTGPWPVLFVLISLLALAGAMGNECLFFATALSGLFAFKSFPFFREGRDRPQLRQWALLFAPVAGCAVWAALFYAFPGPSNPKRIESVHVFTLLAVYARQYSLFDIFVPWFSPVTRHVLFTGWTPGIAAGVIICLIPFFGGLFRLSRVEDHPGGFQRSSGYLLLAILALLAGGSLIYVMGGGFSLESRKKYPLLVFMLLLACWLYRAWGRRRIEAGTFFAAVSAVAVIGAATAWLMVGIWKYETRRYEALADFIVDHQVTGAVKIVANPDLLRAWPQERRALEFGFDYPAVVNFAVAYRGGAKLDETGAPAATILEYDPLAGRWTFATPFAPASSTK